MIHFGLFGESIWYSPPWKLPGFSEVVPNSLIIWFINQKCQIITLSKITFRMTILIFSWNLANARTLSYRLSIFCGILVILRSIVWGYSKKDFLWCLFEGSHFGNGWTDIEETLRLFGKMQDSWFLSAQIR